MFRAIRALSAMLMLATFACTFDHSGLLPGLPPSGNDAASPDAGGGGAIGAGGTRAGGAGAGGTGGSLVNTGGLGPDAFARDDGAGGSGPDADAQTATFDARPDSDNPAGDVVSMPPDATSGDADLDGSIQADASRNCSTVTNASGFTPPGEPRPHCYWFHAFPSHWLGAANTCSAEGGHLVTISSNAETTFVLGLVATFPPNEWLWIGGTDGRFSSDGPGSGPYSWVTGEPMSYTNWYTGDTPEPDGSCKSCGGNPCYCEHRIAIRNDGRWVDGYEAIPYRYICESD